MSHRWFRRLLSLCPTAIAVLWVAGVARFRGHVFAPEEWLAVVAAAFGLTVIARRLQRPRPLPPLPERTNPVTLAALAGGLIAILAGLLGGILELIVDTIRPSETSWALRTAWHAACSFASSYCGFLLRLSAAAPTTSQTPPGRH